MNSEVVMQRHEGLDMFRLMVKHHASDAQWRFVFERLRLISHVNTIYRFLEELAATGAGGILTLPTFNVAMDALGAAGRTREVLWLSEYMKFCRVMPDEMTLCGMMKAHAWHLDTAGVLQWFDYMLQLNIKPTLLRCAPARLLSLPPALHSLTYLCVSSVTMWC
jgi:hypothetical protein